MFHRQSAFYFAAAQNDCSDEEIISFWLGGIEPGATSSADVRR
jgi:hypothetical protein